VPGWHAVQGPACVFGFGNEALAEWLGGNHVLPALAPRLLPELGHPLLNGVKLFLGGRAGDDVAEVRVNGEVSEPASAALRGLDWPRGERLAWARLYVLLLAADADVAAVAEAERGGASAARSASARADASGAAEQRSGSRTAGTLRRWWGARRAGR
jgi:hypothetical protein